MKWEYAGKSSKNVSVFHLMTGNTILESLKYHSVQQSIRLNKVESPRVFFMKPTGLGRNQFNFSNEYGFDMGRIFVNPAEEMGGTVECGALVRQYTFLHNRIPEIIIYDEDGTTPVGICDLKHVLSVNDNPSINEDTAAPVYACLIWSFLWYLSNSSKAGVACNAEDVVFA